MRTTLMPAAAAAAVLLSLGAAQAQTGLRIEKVEQVGDFDKVTAAGATLYAAAWPNLPAARAYCLSNYLKVPYDGIPGFAAGAAAEKIGASRDYACLVLMCNPGKPDPVNVTYQAILFANVAPLPAKGRAGEGVSLRVRYERGQPLLTMFDRAAPDAVTMDGNLRLQSWRVSERRGPARDHVRVEIAFAAWRAFLEQIAYRRATTFTLLPGRDREIPAQAHAGRTVAFKLDDMDRPLAELEPLCARARAN